MEIENSITDLVRKKSNQISNPKDAILIACNLPNYWNCAGLGQRLKIQKVVFPGIVSFSKETGFNRTAEVNEALRVFRSFCDGYKRREIKKAENSEEFSTFVAPSGIEPLFKV